MRKNLMKVSISQKIDCFNKDVFRNYLKKNRMKRGDFLV